MSPKLSFIVIVYGLFCFSNIANSTPIPAIPSEQTANSDAPPPPDLLSTLPSSKTTHQLTNPGNSDPASSISLQKPTSAENIDKFEHNNVTRDMGEFLEVDQDGDTYDDEEDILTAKSRKKLSKYGNNGGTHVFKTGIYAPDPADRMGFQDRKLHMIFDTRIDKPMKGYQTYQKEKDQGERKHFLFDNKFETDKFQLFNKNGGNGKNNSNNKGHFLFDTGVGEQDKLNLGGSNSPHQKRSDFYY